MKKLLLLKKLITVAGLAVLVTALNSSPAAAQGWNGTFCSVRTDDGAWVMKFGPETVSFNCSLARREISRISNLPISDYNSGYYDMNGINRVFTRCGFAYSNITTSTGAYALQNAVNTAMISRLSHCIFAVNRF